MMAVGDLCRFPGVAGVVCVFGLVGLISDCLLFVGVRCWFWVGVLGVLACLFWLVMIGLLDSFVGLRIVYFWSFC